MAGQRSGGRSGKTRDFSAYKVDTEHTWKHVPSFMMRLPLQLQLPKIPFTTYIRLWSTKVYIYF